MKTEMVQRVFAAIFTGCLLAVPNTSDAQAGRAKAPLFDNIGHHQHPVTTQSKKAQRYFDQGLTLCFAFNHTEAIRSFHGAVANDPNLAMAWWGIAYAHGPHVNKPMSQEDNTAAWEAIGQALALKKNASPKEQALIDAMAARYQAEFTEDRSALDQAYADAMRKVVTRYPDDLDAQTLFAEALMDTMPWDYWKSDLSPKPETEEVFAALRFVLKRNPDHPGANHLYIHAVEAGPAPELALPSADRLLGAVPQSGHLVHMPSHIYMRVGQYHDASEANEMAIKADQRYIRACRAQGFYPGVYYPHNVHFLWYAKLFEGRSKDAIKAAEKAAQIAFDNFCGPSKAVEAPRFRHLPWLTRARFGQWEEVLQIKQPPATNDFLIDRVMWHFTRGLAFAAQQQPDAAQAEHDAMVKLIRSEESKALDSPQFPASNILAVADHYLAGKIAGARGKEEEMLSNLEKAVEAEDAIPYMEPAYWPFPTRPAYGAALLRAGKAESAERVFREDLERMPRNGWGLLGLAESLRAQGRVQTAEQVRSEFQKAWSRADSDLHLGLF